MIGLLAPLAPNELALKAIFRTHVNDGMLREVAEADYGWQADLYFPLLIQLRDDGSPPSPHLREVLELIRWSEPEDPAWKPGATGERGHWMRLFCCIALMRMPFFDTPTLAQLTASAVELGEPATRGAAAVLAWRYLHDPGHAEDAAFLAFAILLLAAHMFRGEDDGQWLKQMAEFLMDKDLTPIDLRESVWRALADRILANPASPHPSAADEDLRLLGASIQIS